MNKFSDQKKSQHSPNILPIMYIYLNAHITVIVSILQQGRHLNAQQCDSIC